MSKTRIAPTPPTAHPPKPPAPALTLQDITLEWGQGEHGGRVTGVQLEKVLQFVEDAFSMPSMPKGGVDVLVDPEDIAQSLEVIADTVTLIIDSHETARLEIRQCEVREKYFRART